MTSKLKVTDEMVAAGRAAFAAHAGPHDPIPSYEATRRGLEAALKLLGTSMVRAPRSLAGNLRQAPTKDI